MVDSRAISGSANMQTRKECTDCYRMIWMQKKQIVCNACQYQRDVKARQQTEGETITKVYDESTENDLFKSGE